jgi:hypothetical protein
MKQTLSRPPAKSPNAPVVSEGLDWEAAGWAGIVAGAIFLALQTAFAAWGGGSPGDALRRIAALALGGGALGRGAPSNALVVLAALAVHLPLSLIYARALAAMIDGLRPAVSALWGAVFGVALYFVNYYLFGALFPWFATARGPAALLSHAVFGTVAGGLYAEIARRKEQWR